MSHEAELGFLAGALAVQLGLGVRGGSVRRIAALLAAEVLLAVAARIGRLAILYCFENVVATAVNTATLSP
jgi:hypothetical protein